MKLALFIIIVHIITLVLEEQVSAKDRHISYLESKLIALKLKLKMSTINKAQEKKLLPSKHYEHTLVVDGKEQKKTSFLKSLIPKFRYC